MTPGSRAVLSDDLVRAAAAAAPVTASSRTPAVRVPGQLRAAQRRKILAGASNCLTARAGFARRPLRRADPRCATHTSPNVMDAARNDLGTLRP